MVPAGKKSQIVEKKCSHPKTISNSHTNVIYMYVSISSRTDFFRDPASAFSPCSKSAFGAITSYNDISDDVRVALGLPRRNPSVEESV